MEQLFLSPEFKPQTGKTIVIRRVSVLENGVIQFHGGPIVGLLKPPVHHSNIILMD